MLRKNYTKTRNFCRVTFKLPSAVDAARVTLCGEFNQWNPRANPMKRLKDGSFSTTITLAARKQYRFRYLLDNDRWENDWQADGYKKNDFGSEDSIVRL